MTLHEHNPDPNTENKKAGVRGKPLRQRTILRLIKRVLVGMIEKSQDDRIILDAVKLLLSVRDPMLNIQKLLKKNNTKVEGASPNDDEEHEARILEIQTLLAKLSEDKRSRAIESSPLDGYGAGNPTDAIG